MYREVFNNNFSAMGTRFGIVLPGISNAHGELVTHLIKDEIERLEESISRFIPSSKVSFLNKFASNNPVAVDNELFNIIKRCKEYHSVTGGAFDITLKPVSDYWNRIELNGEYRDDAILSSLLASKGMDNIELIEENCSVFFKTGKLEIDFNSVGKGLALERVKEILVNNGIESAFVSFGESSILAHGTHPNGDNWKIGIPSPRNRNENVYIIELMDSSVSTSGNTANNSIKGRVNIINPFDGNPVKENRTILVASKDPVLAEALSTAFMFLPDDRIKSILANYKSIIAVKIDFKDNEEPVITEFNKV